MNRNRYIACIVGIISLAVFFRAYTPYPIDILGDDATYAFRSVGYFDHMASQLQTTPYQWFEEAPWWAKLSFHDHPPFSFLIYHAAFLIFGMQTWVVTMVPLVMGVVSVWLVMLIAERIGGKRAGFIAGFLAAVASGMIWISRIALLEAVLIPLVLAAFYACLRAREGRRWWVATGAWFGLALITKYTAIFLLPALAVAAVHAMKNKMKRSHLAIGLAVFLLILSPVIVYNLMLMSTRGHPDYQLSRLFQINTTDWREDFSVGRPFDMAGVFAQFTDAVSYAGAALILAAVVWLLRRWWRKRERSVELLLIVMVSFLLGAAWMGGKPWFVVPLVPFLCIAAGVAAAWAGGERGRGVWQRALSAAIVLIVCMSAAYSVNTHFFANPHGRAGLTFAQARAVNYGYEQLDQLLLGIYQERKSAADLWEEGSNETLYIYDSNMNYFPRLWYIQRRVTYQGIPYTSSQEFKKLIQNEGEDYFPQQGFSKYVFIHALPGTLLVPENVRDEVAEQMAHTLEAQGIEGATIRRSEGTPAFRVYEF